MRIIEKTKTFLYKEKGKAKAKLLKLMLGAPFWIIVAALILIARKVRAHFDEQYELHKKASHEGAAA